MRKLMIPAAAAAALAFVAFDAAPAKAQIIRSGYSSPGYYGGYSPSYYGGSGIVIGNGGIGLSAYPAYSGFGSPSYGYSPYYGGNYSYYGTGYRPNYGYGYSGYSGGYRGGYRGGWRR